jgi:Arc/MetJ-type ribon-helix-helix transcriptional regulator
MKRITVDLPEPLYEWIRKAAFDHHESVSAAVRRVLEAWQSREGGNGNG